MRLVIDTEQDPWETYRSMDPDLIQHSENVAQYTKTLYELMMEDDLFPGQLSKRQLIHIPNAVIYHDIGKSVFEDRYINKIVQLTPAERKLLNRHVEIGLMIFQKTMESCYASPDTESFLGTVWQAISQHHERFDGNGYPKGLKGDEISPIGQMCGLCDFYDALTSNRSYRKAIPHDIVVQYIIKERGRHFNPSLVDEFVKHQEEFSKRCLRGIL